MLATAQGLTKVAAKAFVDDTLKLIGDAAVAGEEVNFAGCGKFRVQARAAHEDRNPQTGAAV